MPTYYPQDNTQAFILALVVLIALIAMFTWLSGIYDLRNPLPLEDADDQPAPVLRDVPDQAPIAAEHCAKVAAKRSSIDDLPDGYLCPITGYTGAQFKSMTGQKNEVRNG